MSSRIEIELTSTRPDGVWTWRAAGAKLPKGELDGGLLFAGAKIGDVVRAEAEFLLDGIVIQSVMPPKGARREPERIEIIGTPRRDDEQLITTTLAPRAKRESRGDRGERRPRRDRPEGTSGGPRDGERRDRRPRPEGAADASGDRPARPARPARSPRPARPAPEPKPKPKRLRAARVHRDAVLAALPEEHRPIAEQLLRGGIPAVRAAVDKQNEANRAEGRPEISPAPLLALAEQIQPNLRVAEWRDRAEAALAGATEIDLRDLRSVVVAADDAARDEETRELATQLRAALSARVEAEHTAWLAEIDETLTAGRTVRALRVSSRPPKAGAPFPTELAERLTTAATAALTSETASDRYATVLDALAYSPVRAQVTPLGIPAEPSDALRAAVTKVAGRLPAIAALFGIEVTAPARRAKGAKPLPPKPAAPEAAAEPGDAAPTTEHVTTEPTVAEPPAAPIAEEAQSPAAEVDAPAAEEAPEPTADVAPEAVADDGVDADVEASATEEPAAQDPASEDSASEDSAAE